MATNPAVQQANQALAPVLAELKRQQAEEAARAQGAQATAIGTSQGLAGVLGGIPDQIKGDYKAAGDSAFEYGRRLGQTFATGSKEAAAELQNVLNQNGSPQQIHAAGDAGGSVIAGLGGLIPAQGLAREGAAFTAAARGLGPAALGRGQEQSAAIGRDSADKIRQLDALLRGEKTKLPGLVNDARAQLADTAAKQRAGDQNEIALRAKLGDAAFDKKVTVERLNNERDRIAISKSTAEFNQLLGKAKFSLDENEFKLAIQREKRLSLPKAQGGPSDKEKREMRQFIAETVREGKLGVTDPKTGATLVAKNTPPAQIMRDLIAAGYPFSLIMKVLPRYYPHTRSWVGTKKKPASKSGR